MTINRSNVSYRLYLNDRLYGSATNPAYLTELFTDYVEHCDMHKKEEVVFKVTRKEIPMSIFDKSVAEIEKLIRQHTAQKTDESRVQIAEVKHALQDILELVQQQNEHLKRELSDAEENAIAFESLWLEAKHALEFYANKDHYVTNIRDENFNYHQAVFFDNGELARQILKGESE